MSEAEDAVQEAWLRYSAAETEPVSPKAYLSAVVTRIAIDVLRSARARRETPAGAWLPEPLLSDPYEDPARAAELADSVSTAALLLLERLSPLERATFVLHDVFGFSFDEVADAVGRSEAACRQLAVRARRHMAAGRPRFAADLAAREALADRFFAALHDGELERLRELLADEVQLVGDGGGRAPQWGSAIRGAEAVLRTLASTFPPFLRIGGTVERRRLNRQPGAIFRDREGRVLTVWTMDIAGGRVVAIRAVIDPEKLGHLGPVGDAWAALREAGAARRAARDRRTLLP